MTEAEKHEMQLYRLVGILKEHNSVAASVYTDIALYIRRQAQYVKELEERLGDTGD